MAKQIKIVNASPKRINIVGKSLPRIDPKEVAKALGAEPEPMKGEELRKFLNKHGSPL